jgi:hypothetical protein
MLSERFQVTGVDFPAQIGSRTECAKRQISLRGRVKLPHTRSLELLLLRSFTSHEEHQPLLANFTECLTGGFALLCLGAEHLVDDVDENYLGTRMYWSHYDTDTYLRMLQETGFQILWSRIVTDETCEGAGHLFALVQK